MFAEEFDIDIDQIDIFKTNNKNKEKIFFSYHEKVLIKNC